MSAKKIYKYCTQVYKEWAWISLSLTHFSLFCMLTDNERHPLKVTTNQYKKWKENLKSELIYIKFYTLKLKKFNVQLISELRYQYD